MKIPIWLKALIITSGYTILMMFLIQVCFVFELYEVPWIGGIIASFYIYAEVKKELKEKENENT